MILRPGALLAVAALAVSCATGPGPDPMPGREARLRLAPGAPSVTVPWPAAWRRGALFEVVNGTGLPVETLHVDLSGPGAPAELAAATVEGRPGVPVRILPAPHGNFPLAAVVGSPGDVLLGPGEGLTLRLVVEGSPARTRVAFRVPGVTAD